MQLTIRLLRETDGRWIGDVPELPGVSVYGSTREEATVRAKDLTRRVIAEEIEHGEMKPATDILAVIYRCMSDWSATKALRVLAALQRSDVA